MDIDGCMNDYPVKYTEFVNGILGTSYEYSYEVKSSLPGEIFLVFKRLYFFLHQDDINVRHDLQYVISRLMHNYTVYILTSRSPSYKLSTYKWLSRNHIYYDECFFQQNKFEFVKIIGEKFIAAIIDDHLDFLEEISNDITKIWFRNNLPISSNMKIHSVETWMEVLNILL